MTTIHPGQPSPKEIVAKMVSLHHELGNFQTYLAYQSVPPRWEGEEYNAINAYQSVPPNWESEDYKLVSKVLEVIERETKRMGLAVKKQELDDAVIESLKRAGFEPDDPGVK